MKNKGGLGIKHSSHKLPMSKLNIQFKDALQAVMLVSVFGHLKYKETDVDWMNFKRVEGDRPFKDAMIRHSMKLCPEEEETYLPPEFHVAWNALADLQILIENNNLDIEALSRDRILEWLSFFNEKEL